MIDTHLIAVARGDRPADLLLTHARMINVFTGRIEERDIAIANGRVAGFSAKEAHQCIDLNGRWVAPGFMDAHVHVESAMVTPRYFAEALLACGTTTVVADPHEIANVAGVDGIAFMLDAAADVALNLLWALPSCVPATDMETAGVRLGADDLAQFINHPRVVALAEMMNYPGVIGGDPAVMAKLNLAHSHRRVADGHAPGLHGPGLDAYLAAGVGSDHECTTAEEAEAKLARGMHIMIRESTGAKDLARLLPMVTPANARRIMWCTDDRHPGELLDDGSINSIMRDAIAAGLDPIQAIQMGTLNPAEYFRLPDVGAIAPGYRADLVILDNLNSMAVTDVYAAGRQVSATAAHTASGESAVLEVMHVDPSRVDWSIPAKGNRIRVIDWRVGTLLTGASVETPLVVDGRVVADTERDLVKLAVVERYTGQSGTGLGFVRGLGLKRGAIAASVAHDAHNIVVAGVDDADMALALQTIAEMGGGMVAVADGAIHARIALPVAGLMADRPLAAVRADLDRVTAAARDQGAASTDPFMALGFLALSVIPSFKLTDRGLVDVDRMEIVSLFAD